MTTPGEVGTAERGATVTVASPWGDHTVLHRPGPTTRVQVALADGRTIALDVAADGTATLTGWPADPAATKGQWAVRMSCRIPPLDDMILGGTEVTGVNVRSPAISERVLPGEDEDEQLNVSEAVREQLTALRVALALQNS
jgi:hypothetical protein